MQISVVNGSVEYDGEPILSSIYFDIHDKEKIALVGRNGSGKSTLLKALVGEVPFIKGTGEENLGVYFMGKPVVGYLKQVAFNDENVTLFEEVKNAYSEVLKLEQQLNRALERMQTDNSDEAIKAYATAQERYEIAGGYTYLRECTTAIKKFGFSEDEMNRTLNKFSGGQRTKIALLKLLLSCPEVLLLDEPTNHLDVEAVEWLENYLKNYKYSCVIVSHDRYFLDRIVNVVYEIEYGEAVRYKGNYTSFTEQKKANYEKELKDATAKVKEIERLTKIVERFRYKATKASMAQAKLNEIKRIGTVNAPRKCDLKTFHANFQPFEETVRKTLVLEKLAFGYSKPFGELSFILEKGSKLGIIGANGTGKSTFIKTLMGIIKPLSGSFYFGLKTQIGYFDQTATQSDSTETVLEYFHAKFPSLTDTDARKALGAFNFTGDDVFKRVNDLSGGEKVRLALCSIFKKRPNVLILDEPTNHMDIVGKETIESMLKEYTGTIIVVSHDRYLIDKICDKLLVFGEEKVEYKECNYAEYISNIGNIAITEKKERVEKKSVIDNKAKENKKREKRINTLEKRITEIEEKIEELKEQLNSPSVYSDYVKINELQTQIDSLNSESENLMLEWEELQSE